MEVHAPGSDQNFNKYQYEYSIVISGNNNCSIPLTHALSMDDFGTVDDYNDKVGVIGQKVCVMCFRGDLSQPMIIGAIRNTTDITDPTAGRFWKRRFNGIEEWIDKDGNWSVTSDNEQNIQLNQEYILIDNASGESIRIDKASKTITVNAGKDWTMQLSGNCNINCVNANITASSVVTVEAPLVKLGKSAGEAVVKGDTFKRLFDTHQHIGNMGIPTLPPMMPLDPSALSTKVKTE